MALFLQSHAVTVVSSIMSNIIAAREMFSVFILWLFLMFLRPFGSDYGKMTLFLAAFRGLAVGFAPVEAHWAPMVGYLVGVTLLSVLLMVTLLKVISAG